MKLRNSITPVRSNSDIRGDFFYSFNAIVDDLFNTNFLNLSPIHTELGNPKFNAYRTTLTVDNGYSGNQVSAIALDVFLPYVQKKDIEMECNENANNITLTVRAHQDEKIDENDYFVRQLSRSAFKRTFTIADKNYLVNQATADLNNGILRIVIPCNQLTTQPDVTKKIAIR